MAKEKSKTGDVGTTRKASSKQSDTKTTINGGLSEGASDKPSADNTVSNDSPGATDAGRKNYLRGENQKPVTKAYRDNWNKIFKKL